MPKDQPRPITTLGRAISKAREQALFVQAVESAIAAIARIDSYEPVSGSPTKQSGKALLIG
jgi:hypothetical protein